MEREVAPVDQRYPPARVLVSVTLWPDVMTVEPLAEITGTAGGVQPFAMMATGIEDAGHPFAAVTVTT